MINCIITADKKKQIYYTIRKILRNVKQTSIYKNTKKITINIKSIGIIGFKQSCRIKSILASLRSVDTTRVGRERRSWISGWTFRGIKSIPVAEFLPPPERSASLRELRMRGTKLHAGSNPRRITHTSKSATASRARPRRFPESPGPRNATRRGNNVGAQ